MSSPHPSSESAAERELRADDQEPTLDGLVFAYLQRVDAGDEPESVLRELAHAHPQLGEALRRGVGLLHGAQLHPPSSGAALPERIGPFRVTRRLGAGGMGVVFEARQEHPARRVALKLVRPEQRQDVDSRRRFAREIESVARLSHPGIAAVLETGEHDGIPWYSQELVVGASLSDLIACLPAQSLGRLEGADVRRALERCLAARMEHADDRGQPWNVEFFSGSWVEVALRVVHQVAMALQHAHARGVLHRDVKPANILLTPDGRAVLVDFGLASLGGASRLTRTGMQVGSLHYMPPEQLDGRLREIGPASDVYSLGVTLYELLALRPPFVSQSVERLRGLIFRGEAPEVRRLNSAVPREVSAVCSMAMETAVGRRYGSATDLANDLLATLEHRPTRARPAGPLLRLVRWSQRHPARAVSLLAGVLLFFVAPVAFGLQRAAAAAELARSNAELERALIDSEANLASATQAIERVMRWTANEGLDDVPGLQEVRLRVVEEALAILAGLEASRPRDARLVAMRARLLHTQGDLLRATGPDEPAREPYEASAALRGALLEASPGDPQERFALARTQHGIALSLRNDGRAGEALPEFERALEMMRAVAEDVPEGAAVLEALATAMASTSLCLVEVQGPSQRADRLSEEALAMAERAIELDPARPGAVQTLCNVLQGRAETRTRAGDLRGAARDWGRQVERLEHALGDRPGDRQLRSSLQRALAQWGSLALRTERDTERALQLLERSVMVADTLIADYPGIPEYADERRLALGLMADVRRNAGEPREAYDLLREIARAHRAQAEEAGTEPMRWLQVAYDTNNLANFLLDDESAGPSRFERVLEHCDESQALLERVPQDPANVAHLSMFLGLNRGEALFAMDRLGEFEENLERMQALEPADPEGVFFVAHMWALWFDLTADEFGREMSLEWFAEALELGFADAVLLEETGLEERLGTGAEVQRAAATVRARAAEE